MNKKLLSVSALVVIFAFGFLYLNQAYLVAYDKTSGTCDKTSGSKSGCDKTTGDKSGCDKTTGDKSGCDKTAGNKSSCGDNTNEVKAGSEYQSYQFTTDKACCDGMKADLEKNLLTVAGIKEIKFSTTCNVSKMTNVTVMYSAGETSEENIASFVKDKSIDCSGGNSCNKDGKKTGEKKDGCDTKKECPSMKNKKSDDSKQL